MDTRTKIVATLGPACESPDVLDAMLLAGVDVVRLNLSHGVLDAHLDRMAAEGMRFTEFYSAAEVCTPSRAALLTGRYPIRSGMCHDQFRVLRNRSLGHLPESEITLAEALKAKGYATGCIGKWHLGVWEFNPAGHPRKHGFDYYFGLPHSNDMDPSPFAPKGANKLAEQQSAWWNSPLYRNEKLIERPADLSTLTQRYTDEAVKFIQANKAKPFFLYFPHTYPHTPLFDMMFRTWHLPKDRWLVKYGTMKPIPGGMVGQFLHPFVGPVQEFLEHRADPNLSDILGITPLSTATGAGSARIAALLREHLRPR